MHNNDEVILLSVLIRLLLIHLDPSFLVAIPDRSKWTFSFIQLLFIGMNNYHIEKGKYFLTFKIRTADF